MTYSVFMAGTYTLSLDVIALHKSISELFRYAVPLLLESNVGWMSAGLAEFTTLPV